MGVPYPSDLIIPSREPVKSAKPVKGRSQVGFVNAMNHLAGWRRPWHTYTPSIKSAAFGANKDLGFPVELSTRGESHKLLIPTSKLSSHLDLVMYVASLSDGGTSEPYIGVDLKTLTGATIDEGIQWLRNPDGTLPGGREFPVVRIAGTNYHRVEPYMITTNGRNRDGLAGVPGGTPRMLYLDTSAGDTVVLNISTIGVWLLSCTAFEYPETTL